MLFRSGRVGGHLTENAWFVGFAPRRNPEIVVAVLLEHGQHGALAAPVAREVIKAYYEKKLRGPQAPSAEAARAQASSGQANPAAPEKQP